MSGWSAAVQVTVSNTVHREANTSHRESCKRAHATSHQYSQKLNNSSDASHSPQKNPHSTAQFSELPTFLTFLISGSRPRPHSPGFTRFRPHATKIKR